MDLTIAEAWMILTVAINAFVVFLWVRDPLYHLGYKLGGRIWPR